MRKKIIYGILLLSSLGFGCASTQSATLRAPSSAADDLLQAHLNLKFDCYKFDETPNPTSRVEFIPNSNNVKLNRRPFLYGNKTNTKTDIILGQLRISNLRTQRIVTVPAKLTYHEDYHYDYIFNMNATEINEALNVPVDTKEFSDGPFAVNLTQMPFGPANKIAVFLRADKSTEKERLLKAIAIQSAQTPDQIPAPEKTKIIFACQPKDVWYPPTNLER